MLAEVAASRSPDSGADTGIPGILPWGTSRGDPTTIPIHNTPQAKPHAPPWGLCLTSYRVAALAGPSRASSPGSVSEAFLRDHLPREDRRSRVSTATGLMILLKNLLISREPLYGIGGCAATICTRADGG